MTAEKATTFLRERWARWSLGLWGLLALGTIVRVILSPRRQHFRFYRISTLNWWAGISLYEPSKAGLFRWSPVFATLVSPFAVLPLWLGNILWNLLMLGLLFYSVIELWRWVLPGDWTARRGAVLLMLTFPGVVRGVWSSQGHALAAACLFFALVAIARRRWWRASLLLAVAFWIKLAPLALALLFISLWPRQLGPRYLASLIGLGLLPFVVRDPTFALSEYERWLSYLGSSVEARWGSFRDVWHLWELVELPFSLPVYRFLQVLAGCATAVWCHWLTRRRLPRRHVLTASFAMGGCYLMLFGPAVEFNQYVVIAPFVAWAVLHTFTREGARRTPILAIYVMTLILGFGRIERGLEQITGTPLVTGICTLGVLLFAAWLLVYARSANADGLGPDRQAQ